MVRSSAGAQNSDPLVTRPVPADWLEQRRRADHRARELASPLIEELTTRLRELSSEASGSSAAGAPVHVIDVGAGTGSNQAWLAPRLALPQRWTLLDHDSALLEIATTAPAETEVVETTRVLGTVEDLPGLTTGEDALLVTCSALLDLLTLAEAEILADAIAGAAAGTRVTALLSLSVTGEVQIDPGHPSDALIAEAFDAHQRREALLGPDAVNIVAELLRQRGALVRVAETNWTLDGSDAALIKRYLSDRAAVAVEADPFLAETAADWLSVRTQQLDSAGLQVTVGHIDLLSLPPAHPR